MFSETVHNHFQISYFANVMLTTVNKHVLCTLVAKTTWLWNTKPVKHLTETFSNAFVVICFIYYNSTMNVRIRDTKTNEKH